MPLFTRGSVTIHYEEAGTGFPLLLIPGGGLNSVASSWPRQVRLSVSLWPALSRELSVSLTVVRCPLPSLVLVQVVNFFAEFSKDFRCITMDQRNANGGASSGMCPSDRTEVHLFSRHPH